jgi:hypothetical protein
MRLRLGLGARCPLLSSPVPPPISSSWTEWACPISSTFTLIFGTWRRSTRNAKHIHCMLNYLWSLNYLWLDRYTKLAIELTWTVIKLLSYFIMTCTECHVTDKMHNVCRVINCVMYVVHESVAENGDWKRSRSISNSNKEGRDDNEKRYKIKSYELWRENAFYFLHLQTTETFIIAAWAVWPARGHSHSHKLSHSHRP